MIRAQRCLKNQQTLRDDVSATFRQATLLRGRLAKLAQAVAKKSGGTADMPAIKSLWRVAEQTGLAIATADVEEGTVEAPRAVTDDVARVDESDDESDRSSEDRPAASSATSPAGNKSRSATVENDDLEDDANAADAPPDPAGTPSRRASEKSASSPKIGGKSEARSVASWLNAKGRAESVASTSMRDRSGSADGPTLYDDRAEKTYYPSVPASLRTSKKTTPTLQKSWNTAVSDDPISTEYHRRRRRGVAATRLRG